MGPGSSRELESFSAMKRYYLRSSLQAYAESVEKTNWGTSGPHDAGEYKNLPEDTEFFQERWNSKYIWKVFHGLVFREATGTRTQTSNIGESNLSRNRGKAIRKSSRNILALQHQVKRC
uniref:Beta-amylase n=1 Tax=Brassica oleracea TaxID=3712 RepID=A0A3P6GDF9_BRAOL|nr:unnamed protein product [Brassica oleracea]